jgi:tricorn protease-like protein
MPNTPGIPSGTGMPSGSGASSGTGMPSGSGASSGGKSTPQTGADANKTGDNATPAKDSSNTPPRFNPFGDLPLDPSTVLKSFPDMGWPVRSLAFSADGNRLAVGRIDAGFTVYDIESGKPAFQRERLNNLGPVVAVAWSPDGKYLFTGGQSGKLVSWEVGQPTAKPRNHTGHERTVGCLAVGPEARFILSAGQDRTVVWQQPDAPDKARSAKLPGNGDILAVRIGSPPITAMATDGKELFEIDLKTAAITRTVKLDRRACQGADFSRDGQSVVVSQGREVIVYDTDQGQPKAMIQVGSELQWCVRFTPDGERLLTGGRGAFYVFERKSGRKIATVSVGQPLYVQQMAIDAESRRAAVIPDSAGQTLHVFRLPTTEPK